MGVGSWVRSGGSWFRSSKKSRASHSDSSTQLRNFTAEEINTILKSLSPSRADSFRRRALDRIKYCEPSTTETDWKAYCASTGSTPEDTARRSRIGNHVLEKVLRLGATYGSRARDTNETSFKRASEDERYLAKRFSSEKGFAFKKSVLRAMETSECDAYVDSVDDQTWRQWYDDAFNAALPSVPAPSTSSTSDPQNTHPISTTQSTQSTQTALGTQNTQPATTAQSALPSPASRAHSPNGSHSAPPSIPDPTQSQPQSTYPSTPNATSDPQPTQAIPSNTWGQHAADNAERSEEGQGWSTTTCVLTLVLGLGVAAFLVSQAVDSRMTRCTSSCY